LHYALTHLAIWKTALASGKTYAIWVNIQCKRRVIFRCNSTGYLYAVTASAVSRVQLEDDYSSGQVITVPQIDGIGLSTATVADGWLYVIKSEAGPLALDRPADLPFEFFKVNLGAFDLVSINQES